MENKKRKILNIGQILPGIIESLTRSNIHEQIQLEKIWADIAGDDAAGVVLNGYKDGTVFITVDSAARLYFWKMRRATVLKRFQERRPDVKNIGFKIGKVT